MRIGILQPGYLPWLGFFEQMYRTDVFVIYDDVQYDKHGWRNRNRIKTPQGVQWVTVPVIARPERQPALVKNARIDNTVNWRKKHRQTIRQCYSRAPFFERYIGMFEEGYAKEWNFILDLDMHFIRLLAGALGMGDRTIFVSSSLGVEGDRNERLVNICRHFGADVFYEGASGRNYIDEEMFQGNGIHVEFQDYVHPVYHQLHGGFVPYLSLVDLLFNHGDRSLDILLNKCPQEVSG